MAQWIRCSASGHSLLLPGFASPWSLDIFLNFIVGRVSLPYWCGMGVALLMMPSFWAFLPRIFLLYKQGFAYNSNIASTYGTKGYFYWSWSGNFEFRHCNIQWYNVISVVSAVIIEMSLAKDKSLTVVINGKADNVMKARREVVNGLQTQVSSSNWTGQIMYIL